MREERACGSSGTATGKTRWACRGTETRRAAKAREKRQATCARVQRARVAVRVPRMVYSSRNLYARARVQNGEKNGCWRAVVLQRARGA